MIEFEGADISELIFQRVLEDDPNPELKLRRTDFSQEEEDLLKSIFLKPFTTTINTYQFKHDVDINLNVLFSLSKEIQERGAIGDIHSGIITHLRNNSRHPNIKEGDLFVIKFNNIMMDHDYYDGIGIFKIEKKDSFLETSERSSELGLHFREGIGEKKLDKACLILFDEEPYTVLTVDSNSKEAEFWKEDFINAGFKKDFVNNTNHFLQMTKTYITEKLPEEFEVSKTDQIDLLNKSIKYFKENEEFEQGQFEHEVFEDENAIASFRNFDNIYQEENDLELDENFKIAVNSVKKQARIFKSILKLDKNFHVYIHGNRDLIERGVESDGRKFYKIYYEKETNK